MLVRDALPNRPLLLYRFRYKEDWSGKWRTARYVATREDIASRHKEWEIFGTAELRWPAREGAFNPWKDFSPPR